MKKFITNLVLVICLCATLLCSCGKSGLKDNPATDAQIIGNGGYSVVKGDYLYYVNGYLSDYKTTLSNYKKDNVFGKVTYGAVYRTKINGNHLQKDDNGFLKTTERVVPKVVGFENGGFYIVGDYIYYGTPYMQKNADGVLQNDRVSFNCIKIDGTGNKEMYVSGENVESIDWKVYDYNGNAYLVVVEDKAVTSVFFEGKKVKTTKIAEEVSAVMLNDDTVPANDSVFYTREVKDNEKDYTTSGNLICKTSFVSGGETVYEMDKASKFELKAFTNNRIYYTKELSNTYTCLYALNAGESLKNQTPVQLSDKAYASYYFIDGVNYSVVALDSDDNKTLVKLTNIDGKVERTNITTSISTVVGVKENYVYYIDNSVLKRVGVDSKESQTVSGVGKAEGKTFMLSSASFVELDGRYVYIFASYTSYTSNSSSESGSITSYYLNRIDTYADEMVGEFVGLMDDNRLPEKPSDTTKKWVY